MDSSNLALQYLAYLFGTGAVYRDGSTSSTFLTDINGAMLSYYTAALLLVYAWTILLGLVHSAMDGEFLGRRWHSIGTPVMSILAMAILAPMPGYGMSVGQFVYVRGLVRGSELADKVMRLSVRATEQPRIGGETIPDRARAMLIPYTLSEMCKEQLVRTGGYDPRQIASVCRTPEDLLKWSAPGDNSGTNAVGVTEVDQAIAPQVLPCLAHAYDSMRKARVIYLESELNNAQPGRFEAFKVNQVAMSYAFPMYAGLLDPDTASSYTKGSVAECMARSQRAHQVKPPSTPQLQTDVEKFGWPYMAQYSDRIRNDTQKVDAAPAFQPAVPNLSALSNNPTDLLVKGSLQEAFTELVSYGAGAGTAGSRITGSGGTHDLPVALAMYSATRVAAPENPAALAKLKDAVDKQNIALASASAAKNEAGIAAATGKLGKLKELQNLYSGQQRTMLLGEKILAAIKTASMTREGGKNLANVLGGFGPWGLAASAGVKLISGAISAASAFVMGNPILKNAVIAIGLFWSNADLVPKAILAVAVILWLVRAAAWFMLIPMSAVLAALPDTKVGENVWKEALGVMLSPVVITIMFILGLYVYNVAYQVLFDLLFGWGLTNMSTGELLAQIVGGLLSGSLIFKGILLSFGMVLTYFFMAMLMLSGHDWVMGAMGLRGSNNELGQEMHNLRRHMGGGIV